MKFKLIIPTFLFVVLTLFNSCSNSNVELEEHKEKLAQVEQKLDVQRQTTGDWELAAAGLVVVSIILFTIGTALGAKARRYAKQHRN